MFFVKDMNHPKTNGHGNNPGKPLHVQNDMSEISFRLDSLVQKLSLFTACLPPPVILKRQRIAVGTFPPLIRP